MNRSVPTARRRRFEGRMGRRHGARPLIHEPPDLRLWRTHEPDRRYAGFVHEWVHEPQSDSMDEEIAHP